MRTLRVKDHPNLVRDPHSKAIIVLDDPNKKNVNAQRAVLKNNMQSMDVMKGEINNLKNDINEIKQMLLTIMQKGN